jgi:hypothetical protein
MITQYPSSDKRRVYLACRTVFAGPNAQLRKPKKVRELIEVHAQTAFSHLINDFGLEKVTEIILILLNGRIFQSELKAKIAFPELFRTTPSRDVLRAESENDAARSEAEALEELLSADEAEERRDGILREYRDEVRADEARADEVRATDGKSFTRNNPCSTSTTYTNYFHEQTNEHQPKLHPYIPCTYPIRSSMFS